MSSRNDQLFWVIEFESDSTVEVVPEGWLIGENKSYWPLNPKLTKKVKSDLVRACVDPLENARHGWKIFECRKLISTNDYSKAERAASRAENRTDIELTESEAESTPMSSRKLRPRSLKYFDEKVSGAVSYDLASNDQEDQESEPLQNLFILHQGSDVNEIIFQSSESSSTANPGFIPSPAIPVSSSTTTEALGSTTRNDQTQCGPVVLIPDVKELQADLKEFQRVLLREVQKLRLDVDQILQHLQARNTGENSHEVLEIPSIPVDSIDALNDVETWLEDPTNSSNLILYLRRVGGNDLENFVKRALGRMIGPKLARGMNFTGKNEKTAFQGLALHSCLKSACRKKPSDAEPTDSQIDVLTKKWFGGSADRHGGRSERMKKQIQKTPTEDI